MVAVFSLLWYSSVSSKPSSALELMSSVDLGPAFQQTLVWRIEMNANFLMRMFFFKLKKKKKWWLIKTQALSCGNIPVLLGNSSGERIVRSGKEICIRNVRHCSKTSHVLMQHPSTSTGLVELLMGLAGKYWALPPRICWLLLGQWEWFLFVMVLHQRFGKCLVLAWYRAEKLRKGLWHREHFFLDVPEAECPFPL